MRLRVLPSGLIQTNAYLLTEPARGEAVLVDAPGGIWEKIQPLLAADNCRLAELWLTHGHWDHTQGAAEVVRQTGAKVSAHRADQPLIETPEVMEEYLPVGLVIEPVKVDRWLGQGDRLDALGTAVEARHVPGHCPGNLLFYFPAQAAAFVGDAIFAGSIGRTDLPGGDFSQLERSIRGQIYTLPDATRLYPGHGDATTVADEKAGNPYVSEA
ncbi:MAG: MBL fold metallo-hydrolase [Opitutaceae bacterium]|jgi:glyoxylase-like metal-dependent hydrolase (beta-lactamase superfamily II)|nr:MBL fold metallo-hydrolase [Opitutaceae bacterium]